MTSAVVGVLLLGAPLVTGCEPTGTIAPQGAPTSPSTSAPSGSPAYRITTRNEEGSLGPDTTYSATVPVLEGPDAAVVDRVNTAIAEYVRQEKAGTSYANLTLKAGDPHVGRQVLALSFGGDRYPPGAAHPAELASGLVFDLRTGDRVTIEDVFTSTGDGLRRLESIVRPELDRRFPGGPTGGVTDPEPANYQQFVVNPRGLVVIVADLPYVLGPQSVLAPWDQLADLVRPELADVLRS
ncbi:hypothetical protein UG55_105445 [Frankia sp. EI5c]|nr:hypothetical protein UG55_105445 [Frankia sp. EI5c]